MLIRGPDQDIGSDPPAMPGAGVFGSFADTNYGTEIGL
jgi:hypothetical protein